MSWTYSDNPSSSPKDYVRFLIGDTIREEPLLNDQEIQNFLNMYNDGQGVLQAAVRCCEGISAKFSRRVSETVGKVKMEFQQAAKAYRDLAMDLRRRLLIEEVKPYSSGLFVGDKIANATNPGIVRPDFSKQMMDNNQISPTTNIDSITASIANQSPPE